jgi:hypothetical protein
MGWTRHIALRGAMRNACEILVKEPVRKRALKILRYRCEYNNRMDLIEK